MLYPSTAFPWNICVLCVLYVKSVVTHSDSLSCKPFCMLSFLVFRSLPDRWKGALWDISPEVKPFWCTEQVSSCPSFCHIRCSGHGPFYFIFFVVALWFIAVRCFFSVFVFWELCQASVLSCSVIYEGAASALSGLPQRLSSGDWPVFGQMLAKPTAADCLCHFSFLR